MTLLKYRGFLLCSKLSNNSPSSLREEPKFLQKSSKTVCRLTSSPPCFSHLLLFLFALTIQVLLVVCRICQIQYWLGDAGLVVLLSRILLSLGSGWLQPLTSLGFAEAYQISSTLFLSFIILKVGNYNRIRQNIAS